MNEKEEKPQMLLEQLGIPKNVAMIMLGVVWVGVLCLIIYSIININALVSDPCAVCTNTTDAVCTYLQQYGS
jgi:hypothetical protein|tara:strand:- start:770 stop:985 length:216 start_codon:yes stop_codon:yes gene_type:complete